MSLYISLTEVVILVLHDYLDENSWGHVMIEKILGHEGEFSPIFFDEELIVLQSQGVVKEIHLYNEVERMEEDRSYSRF